MSDHYTFITDTVKKELADQVEETLKKTYDEYGIQYQRVPRGHLFYFAGHFKNLGGGPWPECFAFEEPYILTVIINDEGKVWRDGEFLEEKQDA